MNKVTKHETTRAIELAFFTRNATAFETYYRLRVKGYSQSASHNLLHEWLEERVTLEAVFGNGKE